MRYGPNSIGEGARRSELRMLLAQFTDFMILLLIAAAVVSGFIGEAEDTVVILGIVVLMPWLVSCRSSAPSARWRRSAIGRAGRGRGS